MRGQKLTKCLCFCRVPFHETVDRARAEIKGLEQQSVARSRGGGDPSGVATVGERTGGTP